MNASNIIGLWSSDARPQARTTVVIPCYNEEQRLPVREFVAFAATHPQVRFLFVDDGSRDGTWNLLDRLPSLSPLFAVHRLERNQGKGEAVRQGCLRALTENSEYIGFWDADLATPLQAIPDFMEVMIQNPHLEMVSGARVQLLGRSIRRKWARHILGRIFATAASIALGMPVYDTQCGAKLFRVTGRTPSLFEQRFRTRWLFDVEILARLINLTAQGQAIDLVYEYPLKTWTDIKGSKVKASDFPKAFLELADIYRTYLTPAKRHAKAQLPVEIQPPVPRRTAA